MVEEEFTAWIWMDFVSNFGIIVVNQNAAYTIAKYRVLYARVDISLECLQKFKVFSKFKKLILMLKQISTLGKTLNKKEQRQINGGRAYCTNMYGVCFEYGIHCGEPQCQFLPLGEEDLGDC